MLRGAKGRVDTKGRGRVLREWLGAKGRGQVLRGGVRC